MQQLQPQCAELKNRAQARNRDLKAAEVHNHNTIRREIGNLCATFSVLFVFHFSWFRLVFIVKRLTWETLKRIKISLTSGSENSNTGTSKVYRKETTLRNIILVPFPAVSLWSNPSSLSSISQTNSADTHARVEKMSHIQAELEQLSFQDSTLAQQIDQFQQASAAAKDRLGKMRLVQLLVKVFSIHRDPTMMFRNIWEFYNFHAWKSRIIHWY